MENKTPVSFHPAARRLYPLVIAAACFAIVVIHTALRSATNPPDLSPEDRHVAVRECEDAVQGDIPDARFPFDPDVSEVAGGGLLLSGSVDSGSGITATRRNYECFLRKSSASGAYRADSVEVWQSH